nr:MAG TPA: hypothetical protein [Caudoviricetes sp.]
MFQNSFMSTLDDTSYKLSGTGVCNIGFGLVANPSALLKPFQNYITVNGSDELHISIDNFHAHTSSVFLFGNRKARHVALQKVFIELLIGVRHLVARRFSEEDTVAIGDSFVNDRCVFLSHCRPTNGRASIGSNVEPCTSASPNLRKTLHLEVRANILLILALLHLCDCPDKLLVMGEKLLSLVEQKLQVGEYHALHPLDSCRYHICGMGVENIREDSTGSPVAVPVLLAVESSHVPSDTVEFFIGELHETLCKDNGFLTVSGEQSGVVVLPCFIALGLDIVIELAQVVEHTHNVGASLELPLETELFCHFDKSFCYLERVIEQSPVILPVMVNGSGFYEKSIVEKLNDDFFAHILAHEINHLVDTALFLFGASDFDNHALPSSLSARSRYFFKYQSAFLISSTPFLFLCR